MTKEELGEKVCRACRRTMDLAQCPECHFWFCKAHDMHECMPEQVAHLQKQIAAIKKRRDVGIPIMLYGGVWAMWGVVSVWLSGRLDLSFLGLFMFIAVALLALGYVIWRHYDGQLRQLGIRVHGIRLPNR